MGFLNYLRRPTFFQFSSPSAFNQKLKDLVITYLVYLCLLLLLMVILYLLDKMVFQFLFDLSPLSQIRESTENNKDLFGLATFPIVVFAGPFLEELIFRLPLKLKREGIAIALVIFMYQVTGGHFFEFNFSYFYDYLRILLAIASLIIIIRFLPILFLEKLKKNYFNYVFYFSAVAFALVHISNFKPYSSDLLLLYPLLVLPQFLMGLCIGYLRMKHGFLMGFLLHALINLPFVFLS